ncbi:MAG TPA: hypothetical protein VHS78_08835 [Candidatus Elarobacter sp.]|jgi:hypothetical protein|nr:hypothetical protein [Candidatus Elarobacter sp.]
MQCFRGTKIAALAVMLVACLASAACAAHTGDLAPADEYFGQLRMSVLGIRNELNALERRATSGDRNVSAMSGKLAMVDDAMRDWRAHYPRDTWLPRFQQQRSRVAALIASGGYHVSRYMPSAAGAAAQFLSAIRHP